MSAYRHILYATDLHEPEGFMQKISDIVKIFGAKLTLIHVIEPIPAYGYPGFVDLENPFIDQAKQEMASLAKKLNVPEEHQRVEFGSIKTQVLHVAEQLKVDLIIVGSHGRHGLSILLGSSASAIVNGSACDVLTLRVEEK